MTPTWLRKPRKGWRPTAEDLSYVLKNLERATLVGETTGGEPIRFNCSVLTEIFSAQAPRFSHGVSAVSTL